jgi:pectate lyase
LKHCITVHDFSKNFKCKEQTEIQSDYFQKQEVSIHFNWLDSSRVRLIFLRFSITHLKTYFISKWYLFCWQINKNDVKRVRLGPKKYSSHPVQILIKTQTEVFHDFQSAFPNINVSQRVFERCKPFFVRSANIYFN